MKYILLMYDTEGVWQGEELVAAQAEAVATCRELHNSGRYVDASPLEPVATARSVRVRNGAQVLSDGPFAETKEQLGGYVLIDVENLDQAIDIASRFPSARKGVVEVRPLLSK